MDFAMKKAERERKPVRGASTITKPDGSRMPSENELAIARFQGKHTAEIAKKLASR